MFLSRRPCGGPRETNKTFNQEICNHFSIAPVRYFQRAQNRCIPLLPNTCFVRKFTAIILFTTFFISQYARLAGYLECRLANYFSTDTIKCDCERILLAGNGPVIPMPAPVPHNHLHLDELFYPLHPLEKTPIPEALTPFLTTGSAMLYEGVREQIDHPPQHA
jgi:hypothetical protein